MLKIEKSMIETRSEEVCFAEIHNKKYEEFLSQTCKIQKQIERIVPEYRKNKYFQLCERLTYVEAQRHGIELKETYKQGFMDALEIAVLLWQQKR